MARARTTLLPVVAGALLLIACVVLAVGLTSSNEAKGLKPCGDTFCNVDTQQCVIMVPRDPAVTRWKGGGHCEPLTVSCEAAPTTTCATGCARGADRLVTCMRNE